MRISVYLIYLLLSLVLFACSEYMRGYVTTYTRSKCEILTKSDAPKGLASTQLKDSNELVLTKYLPISVNALVLRE